MRNLPFGTFWPLLSMIALVASDNTDTPLHKWGGSCNIVSQHTSYEEVRGNNTIFSSNEFVCYLWLHTNLYGSRQSSLTSHYKSLVSICVMVFKANDLGGYDKIYTISNDNTMLLCSDKHSYIYKWDGTTWTTVCVNALTVFLTKFIVTKQSP